MTVEHFIFIPGVLLVGIAIGWNLGTNAMRKEIERRQAKMKE
ncbi:MAG: hypothetical protein ACXVEF_29850 [Polyangiales bacterium]